MSEAPNGMRPPVASVVIPTYNRRGSLTGLVKSLLSDPGVGEIVVVVDGSEDGSYQLLLELADEDARVIPIYQSNAGEGAARQRGLESSRYDTVVFLDDDVMPGTQLVSGHLRHHLGGTSLVVLGYMPTSVPLPRRAGQAPTILYARNYEAMCRLYESEPENILLNLWAGNISIGRQDALRIGLAGDPALGYHADLAFGIRCHISGMKGVFDRSLYAEHSLNRSLTRFAAEWRRSGDARARLSHSYPMFALHLDPTRGAGYVRGHVLDFLASRRIARVSSGLVRRAAELAGRLRLWRTEVLGARLLRQIEIRVGYQSFERSFQQKVLAA
jgi:glycosyltransferase involved in cell wall biosynthesis